MGNARKIAIRFLLPLISVTIFVIVVEATLWIFNIDPHPRGVEFTVNRALDYPDVFLKDRDLFWRLRPDRTIVSEFFEDKSYRINKQGFRGDDFKREKTGLKIAVLGNSCSFGWGIDEDSTFAGRLETYLHKQAGLWDAEVYNFSVPGYSSYQGVRNYKENIRPYNPDFLLVTFGWNDQWSSANDRPDNMQEMPPQWILDIYNLIGRTRLYRLYKSLIFAFRGPYETPVYRDQQARVGLADFKANLGEIIATARQDGVRVVLLTSPIPSMADYYHTSERSYMHERHYSYNEMTREAAATFSAGLVDLAAIFDQYDNLFDDVSKDPFHYNETGHALAAAEIYRFLMESGVFSLDH
jgi:lysophospholipase L1-like esterase